MRFRQRGCVLDRGGPFTLCGGGAYGRHVVLLTELWCFTTVSRDPLKNAINA